MAADDIRAAMANVAGLIADGILHAGWRDDLGILLRIAEAAVAETDATTTDSTTRTRTAPTRAGAQGDRKLMHDNDMQDRAPSDRAARALNTQCDAPAGENGQARATAGEPRPGAGADGQGSATDRTTRGLPCATDPAAVAGGQQVGSGPMRCTAIVWGGTCDDTQPCAWVSCPLARQLVAHVPDLPADDARAAVLREAEARLLTVAQMRATATAYSYESGVHHGLRLAADVVRRLREGRA